MEDNSNLPATIIGWSWGYMLGFILAARYPSIIKKLILVSRGAFSKRHDRKIKKTKFKRLSREERVKFKSVIKELEQ
jgi:pimeloyl-ACP methyl ester carboxylesterase